VTRYEKTQDQKPCCTGKWEKPQYIVEPTTLLQEKKKKNYDKGAGSSNFMIKSATTSRCCWGAVSVFGSKKMVPKK
jgi:hypothetical protein